ncbi:hypothetical protein GCM10023403_62620 [Pseudonocardia benzenivorans]
MTGPGQVRDRLPEAVLALRWDRAVLARPLGPVAAVVAGLAAVVLVVGAVLVAGHDYASTLDERITLAAPRGQVLFAALVAVGDVMSAAVLTVVLVAVCLAAGRPRHALLALLAPAATGVVTTVLKPLVGRTLDGADSYPSGHTGFATSLALVTGLLLASAPAVRATAARIAVLVVVTLLGAAPMAVALVAQHVHYPTDTVGGFCTALVVVLVVALLVDGVVPAVTARARPGVPPGG